MLTESERRRDTQIRLTVFSWLEEQTQIHGDVPPWSLLAHGLFIDGERVPLVSQQGIWTLGQPRSSSVFSPPCRPAFEWRCGADPLLACGEILKEKRPSSLGRSD